METHWKAIRDILIQVGEQVEGNLVCDIHPDNILRQQNNKKIQNLQSLAKGKKHICEIGVNAGHSLLLMLEVNPTAEYVLFDIGTHKYTRPCVEYIQSQFINTSIRIFYGDSKQTVPLFQGEFDLIHVDGGHTGPEVRSDYKESMRLIAPHSPIVFDDYNNYTFIHQFLNEKLRIREISLYTDPTLVSTDQHLIFTNPSKVSPTSESVSSRSSDDLTLRPKRISVGPDGLITTSDL